MTDMRRRTVLTTLAAVPLSAIAEARTVPAAAARAIFLYDPALADAVRQAEAMRTKGHVAVPVTGDPVRLARAVFPHGPVRIDGMTRHADRLILLGEAAEHGYREVPAPDGIWRAVRRRDA